MTRREIAQLKAALNERGVYLCVWDPYVKLQVATIDELAKLLRGVRL